MPTTTTTRAAAFLQEQNWCDAQTVFLPSLPDGFSIEELTFNEVKGGGDSLYLVESEAFLRKDGSVLIIQTGTLL